MEACMGWLMVDAPDPLSGHVCVCLSTRYVVSCYQVLFAPVNVESLTSKRAFVPLICTETVNVLLNVKEEPTPSHPTRFVSMAFLCRS